jgi:hypothetical protein
VSALLAREKKSNIPKILSHTGVKVSSGIEDIKTSIGELLGYVGIILGGIFCIALALGLLWGIIAIVKWMWIHS